MRACLGCGRPSESSRCPDCRRANTARRKAQGLTGERGSTHASRKRRERTLQAAGHRCHYCGAPASIEDHYLPLARGGTDDESNTIAACVDCNREKSDRDPKEFMASSWLARRCADVANGRVAA